MQPAPCSQMLLVQTLEQQSVGSVHAPPALVQLLPPPHCPLKHASPTQQSSLTVQLWLNDAQPELVVQLPLRQNSASAQLAQVAPPTPHAATFVPASHVSCAVQQPVHVSGLHVGACSVGPQAENIKSETTAALTRSRSMGSEKQSCVHVWRSQTLPP